MARINVDEKWFKDPRRERLALVLSGPLELADGVALSLWRLGQSYWQNERGLVPLRIWSHVPQREAYETCGLVEVREDGVYVCGAVDYFDWLHSRTEAGRKGGMAGLDRPRDAQGHYLGGAKTAPSKTQANAKQNPSNHQANTKLTQASSSSSSSSSEEFAFPSGKESKAGPMRASGTAAAAPPPPSPDRLPPLAKIWNEERGTLGEVRKVNSARSRKAAVRFGEHSADEWREVVRKVRASAFCNGKNDRGWRATFDWLLQPDSALRVLEGKYDTVDKKSLATEISDADWETIFGEKRA